MKPALLALYLLTPATLACEPDHRLALSGTAIVENCSPPESTDCVYADSVLHPYLAASPDGPTVMGVGVQSSPWRLYDGDMRILTIQELAETVRANRDATEMRIALIRSWTGVAPSLGVPSLADRPSKALDGLLVRGEDGFLWVKARRLAPHHAPGLYGAHGHRILSPADGWRSHGRMRRRRARLRRGSDPRRPAWDAHAGRRRLGRGFLCPDKALAGFERAAANGSAITACDSALMRLERGRGVDRAAAIRLLERGAALGDAKSDARLQAERK